MKLIITIAVLMLLSSCASLFKDSRQQVFFRGGPSGITTVNTPDGKFEIDGGSGAYLMTRSKSDIPITVKCPNGKTTQAIIETKFDFLVGGVANIIFWPALFYDPFQGKAYNIPDITLNTYCNI